jgi:Holliday junction resolvasome RuvABC endonuclease subunit
MKSHNATGIAIDPSTTETGVVIFYDDCYETICHFVITAAGLREMMEKVVAVIIAHADTLDWVAVEDVYHGPNTRVTINLAKLIGAICAVAAPNCRYFEFSTDEINPAAGIATRLPSKARKAALLAQGKEALGPDITQHEADALAVGKCAIRRMQELGLLDSG